uniref:Uncharacterized protein n=1 Tax=Anopheles coluzzii TaxID=1518534 RepID=A0A8W7PA10_ANOCL
MEIVEGRIGLSDIIRHFHRPDDFPRFVTFRIISSGIRPARRAAPPGLTLSTNTGLSPDTFMPYPVASLFTVTTSVCIAIDPLAGDSRRNVATHTYVYGGAHIPINSAGTSLTND